MKKNKKIKYLSIILLILICDICTLYAYKYITVLWQEYQEQCQIKQLIYNMFPDILPDILSIYTNRDIVNNEIPSTANRVQSKSSSYQDSNHNWVGDCILTIPDINLEKIVYTGSNRLEHLKEYGLATASDTMEYKNGGNYIICGHASRLYGHSLNRIKELEKGDAIYIKTRNGTDRYIVKQVRFENMNKTSRYCNQTETRQLTIISCAKYVSKSSYIVITAVLD